MSALDGIKEMKVGRLAAIVEILEKEGGPDIIDELLRGEVGVQFKDVARKLFDKHGRAIPRNIKGYFQDADYKNAFLWQPKIDYLGYLTRFQKYFGPIAISASDFENRVKQLKEQLENNGQLSNMLKGIWLPVILPSIPCYSNYGQLLQEKFLVVLEQALKDRFPDRKFDNRLSGELISKVSVVECGGHHKLIAKMSQSSAKDPAWGIYFPIAFQGYSYFSAAQWYALYSSTKNLPENLLLTGGFDTITAIITWIDVLTRDCNVPNLETAATLWKGGALDFGVCKRNERRDEFYLCGSDFFNMAYGNTTSGLFFLG